MSERKVVDRGIAIGLAVISLILLIGIGGVFAYYAIVVGNKDSTIQTLTSQNNRLEAWLDGNMTMLESALAERGIIEALLEDQRSGLPGIQSNFTSVLALLDSTQSKLYDLRVETVAEDDPLRDTGIMVLGLRPTSSGWPSRIPVQTGADLVAHYKIVTSLNGIPISPLAVIAMVVRVDYRNPSTRQFPSESTMSGLTEVSSEFVCMYRPVAPGVGALDVYYVGPQTKEHVANYILVVQAYAKIGGHNIFGTDLQDLCVLGWSMDSHYWVTALPDGEKHYGWEDPLGPFASCDEAVFWQRAYLGLSVLRG